MLLPRGLSLTEPLEPFRSSWLTAWARDSRSENSRTRGAWQFSFPGRCSSTPLRMSGSIDLLSFVTARGFITGLGAPIGGLFPLGAFLFGLASALHELLAFRRSSPVVDSANRVESRHIIQDTTNLLCRRTVRFLDSPEGPGALAELPGGERSPENRGAAPGDGDCDFGVIEGGPHDRLRAVPAKGSRLSRASGHLDFRPHSLFQLG